MKAGAEYRDQLAALGLDPEGLLWAFDSTVAEYVLVLITSHLDHAGPLSLYGLLTRAYNASATPASIDPFIIRMHSPNQLISKSLLQISKSEFKVENLDPSAPAEDSLSKLIIGCQDLQFTPRWVYYFREHGLAPAERNRQWKRFKGRVEALPLAA